MFTKDRKVKVSVLYFFVHLKAAKAIDAYLGFRERCGEKITPTSPLFRKDFDTDFHEQARTKVQTWIKSTMIVSLHRELIKNGLVTVDRINPHRNRKDVKMSHGFRKFFETMLVNAGIHETIIRKLTGHSDSGNLTQLYSKQTVEEMKAAYEMAIDLLTVNSENRLKREVSELKSKKDPSAEKIATLETTINKLLQTLVSKGVLSPNSSPNPSPSPSPEPTHLTVFRIFDNS